ncbi:sulfite exporter TauE/SafE family protein [Microbulbifer agarilyticus]|uniref:cytochrome c biogenesis CcdA family protein n=1 Tax=Microbulbifer agarilyticus TaxID=260552 RepID=UPI001C93BC9E|nr:cytochrome c biogenesis protein CcdA [Microbulbifer agarilyticus]MBY6210618.1 sulfite exporter TauE/SafE family protein [Microbulbifer agarilyticus]
MGLEFAAIPLAFIAGIVGILSPCVWPLVPVVMTSSSTGGRRGPFFMSLGLACAFAIAGTVLTLLLINLGLDPVAYRNFAAVLLIFVALTLIIPRLGYWLSGQLSRLTSGFGTSSDSTESSGAGQFFMGALLGLVWLPCVGPTLGAAIALASVGQQVPTAFLVMFVFGVGTASALLVAAYLSGRLLNRWRGGIMTNGERAKKVLGVLLLVLGVMVLSGLDKVLEAFALGILPDWALSL